MSVIDLFSIPKAARLLGVTTETLQAIAQNGATPSGQKHGRPAYSFAEIAHLRRARSTILSGLTGIDFLRAALEEGRPKQRRKGTLTRLDGVLCARARARDMCQAGAALAARASSDAEGADVHEAGAIALLEGAIDLDPRYATAFVEMGVIRLRRDRHAEAEAYLEKAAELDPLDPRPFRHLGTIYLARGEPRRAVHVLSRARRLDSENSETIADLALAHATLGEVGPAATCWHRYLKIAPSGPYASTAQAWLTRAARHRAPSAR